MSHLRVRLFGTFHVSDGTQVLKFRTDKMRALFAYLLLAKVPQRRDVLATLLWGDLPDKKARTNLRLALSRLRKLLAPYSSDGVPILAASRETVDPIDRQQIALDVVDFDTLIDGVETHPHAHLDRCPQCLQRLHQVADLYRGTILAGLSFDDAPQFEHWRVVEQELRHRKVLSALHVLAAHRLTLGEWVEAEALARRQIGLEPWYEVAYRQLMLALAEQGDLTGAVAVYQQCQATLADELGAEPMAETAALLRELVARGARRRVNAATLPLHSLPREMTPFFGRTQELKQIIRLLNADDCPLLTLIGAGGNGKTRLALAAGRKLLPQCRDGVWFVSLDNLAAGDGDAAVSVANAVAAVLPLQLMGNAAPQAQVQAWIDQRKLLIIIDNFEQLAESAARDWLLTLLRSCPNLTLLVTSRVRLNLQAETVFRVSGLQYPTSHNALTAHTSPAVSLFENRAQRSGPFVLSEQLASVVAACHRVQGSPLGIELMASLTADQPLSTMLDDLAALQTPYADVLDRHSGVMAVVDYSWRLLSQRERSLLAGLALFEGQFAATAAATTLDVSVAVLDGLVDKSLVQQRSDRRYALHPFVRQFVTAQRGFGPVLQAAAARYCRHYLGELLARHADLYGQTPHVVTQRLQADHDNVVLAWRRALVAVPDMATAALPTLLRYFRLANRLFEAQVLLRELLPEVAEDGLLRGWVSAELAYLTLRLGGSQASIPDLLATASAAATRFADHKLAMTCKHVQADGLIESGDMDAARPLLDAVVAESRAAGWHDLLIRGIQSDGTLTYRIAEYARYRNSVQALVAHCEATGNRYDLAGALNALGTAHYYLGEDAQTLHHYEASLALARSMDNRNLESQLLMHLGICDMDQGAYERAAARFGNAQQIASDLGTQRRRATIAVNMGILWRELAQFERARASYALALDINRRSGNRYGEGGTLAYLSLVHLDRRDYVAALASAESAEIITRETGDTRHLIFALRYKARALVHLEEWDAAQAAYDSVLTYDHEPVLATSVSLAYFAFARGDLVVAQQHLETVVAQLATLDTASESDLPYVFQQTVALLRALGDDRSAEIAALGQALVNGRAERIADASMRTHYAAHWAMDPFSSA